MTLKECKSTKVIKDLKAKMSYQMFTAQGQWPMDEFPITCFNHQSNILFRMAGNNTSISIHEQRY
jgi:hypothetical protein